MRMAPEIGGIRVVGHVSDDPIRIEELLKAGSSADGAVTVFAGRVRDHNHGRPVIRLHYEAYGEMAERELVTILDETARRWTLSHLEAVHRTGTLELGELSVAIVVAAPHRATAYEASRHVIEEIKRRLPIWKREEYADGQVEWVGSAPSEA
jgi:molybdopterin synthase catalytic subunit